MPTAGGIGGFLKDLTTGGSLGAWAGDAVAAPDLHHELAEGFLVEADTDHENLAFEADKGARKRQGRAPLAGAGLGGEPLDAELLIVPGLRHGGIGFVAAGRAGALVLVIDAGGRVEIPLEVNRPSERRRTPAVQDVKNLFGDVDPPLGADFLFDNVHRKHGGEHLRRDRLAVGSQGREHRIGQIDRDVVPLSRDVFFVK